LQTLFTDFDCRYDQNNKNFFAQFTRSFLTRPLYPVSPAAFDVISSHGGARNFHLGGYSQEDFRGQESPCSGAQGRSPSRGSRGRLRPQKLKHGLVSGCPEQWTIQP